jgi:hypothetical protein
LDLNISLNGFYLRFTYIYFLILIKIMQLEFVIGKETKYTARTSLTKEELFGHDYNKKQKFKIPIKV